MKKLKTFRLTPEDLTKLDFLAELYASEGKCKNNRTSFISYAIGTLYTIKNDAIKKKRDRELEYKYQHSHNSHYHG